jgi:hypothetical protein
MLNIHDPYTFWPPFPFIFLRSRVSLAIIIDLHQIHRVQQKRKKNRRRIHTIFPIWEPWTPNYSCIA